MIAFSNGNILFFDDENDKEPKKLKTELNKILGAQWEPKGTFFIVTGNFNDSKEKIQKTKCSAGAAAVCGRIRDISR